MFFCLPILFGCQTKIKPDASQPPRICPRCHNASIVAAKSKLWFEFFFVPIFPMSSDHIWICTICQFRAPLQTGQWEPQVASNFGYFPPPQQQNWTAPNQPGYQPAYIVQSPQK
ncbi:hypothetical protein PTI98_002626 [Pleurotus ostreatus]|uniref:Uncharacterized protein n=1 Tax=Pleurotus ostreatus (strain PC15) TaxID=1137138 RepID=A0A067P134_PLEO1|nr:hypothetical protein PTI98_002626 [Pleurotus ostreatus]KDQ33824.1 hypothetical protein PLEOSDRAFT_1052643 [Pleurotus ostreatus PC15]